jgi:hypothetical protein
MKVADRMGQGWIYRIIAKPMICEGERPVPLSVLAPESALGSVPTVALSSAQIKVVIARGKFQAERKPVKTHHDLGNIFG